VKNGRPKKRIWFGRVPVDAQKQNGMRELWDALRRALTSLISEEPEAIPELRDRLREMAVAHLPSFANLSRKKEAVN